MPENTPPTDQRADAWRIVRADDDQPWPCTIVDSSGRSLLAVHDRTPIFRSADLAETVLASLNALPIDAEGDEPLFTAIDARKCAFVCWVDLDHAAHMHSKAGYSHRQVADLLRQLADVCDRKADDGEDDHA